MAQASLLSLPPSTMALFKDPSRYRCLKISHGYEAQRLEASRSNLHCRRLVQIDLLIWKMPHVLPRSGILEETGSVELVILCHGFRSSKSSSTIASLADAITKGGISVFRFDFAGNGDSEGSFQYGNYLREADDLRAVIEHFSRGKHAVITILGHSKGGDVVLLYASKYSDVPTVINVSGRYNLEKGVEERLGKDFMQNIKRDGFIDVIGKKVMQRFVWVYASVQFILVVLSAHLFYSLLHMQAVLAILLSTFAGFGVAMSANSILIGVLRWRQRRRRRTLPRGTSHPSQITIQQERLPEAGQAPQTNPLPQHEIVIESLDPPRGN